MEDRGGFICGSGGRFIEVVVEADGKFEAATAAPGELSSSLIGQTVNTERSTKAATMYAILIN